VTNAGGSFKIEHETIFSIFATFFIVNCTRFYVRCGDLIARGIKTSKTHDEPFKRLAFLGNLAGNVPVGM